MAAPTAGLHFTKELLKQIEDMGVKIARVTLHVGLGTFRPVKVENILDHHMHSEFYQVDKEAADINISVQPLLTGICPFSSATDSRVLVLVVPTAITLPPLALVLLIISAASLST